MMHDPTAAFLAIGDELLSGKVVETNSACVIGELRERGISLKRIWFVPDCVEEIAFSVADAARRCDHVFTSGGVGPTHDDVTFAGVARAFDRKVERHPEVARRIEDYFGAKTNDALLKMAEAPAGAELVQVIDGLVPVLKVENVFIFPGVPILFKRCFQSVASGLRGRPFFLTRLYTTLDESAIADLLVMAQRDNEFVAIGSYPRYDRSDYQVMITLESREEGVVENVEAFLRERLPGEALVEPTD